MQGCSNKSEFRGHSKHKVEDEKCSQDAPFSSSLLRIGGGGGSGGVTKKVPPKVAPKPRQLSR